MKRWVSLVCAVVLAGQVAAQPYFVLPAGLPRVYFEDAGIEGDLAPLTPQDDPAGDVEQTGMPTLPETAFYVTLPADGSPPADMVVPVEYAGTGEPPSITGVMAADGRWLDAAAYTAQAGVLTLHAGLLAGLEGGKAHSFSILFAGEGLPVLGFTVEVVEVATPAPKETATFDAMEEADSRPLAVVAEAAGTKGTKTITVRLEEGSFAAAAKAHWTVEDGPAVTAVKLSTDKKTATLTLGAILRDGPYTVHFTQGALAAAFAAPAGPAPVALGETNQLILPVPAQQAALFAGRAGKTSFAIQTANMPADAKTLEVAWCAGEGDATPLGRHPMGLALTASGHAKGKATLTVTTNTNVAEGRYPFAVRLANSAAPVVIGVVEVGPAPVGEPYAIAFGGQLAGGALGLLAEDALPGPVAITTEEIQVLGGGGGFTLTSLAPEVVLAEAGPNGWELVFTGLGYGRVQVAARENPAICAVFEVYVGRSFATAGLEVIDLGDPAGGPLTALSLQPGQQVALGYRLTRDGQPLPAEGLVQKARWKLETAWAPLFLGAGGTLYADGPCAGAVLRLELLNAAGQVEKTATVQVDVAEQLDSIGLQPAGLTMLSGGSQVYGGLWCQPAGLAGTTFLWEVEPVRGKPSTVLALAEGTETAETPTLLALAKGSARVKVTASHAGVSHSTTLAVTVSQAVTALTISNKAKVPAHLNVGQRFRLTTKVDGKPADATVLWSSSDETVATVDAAGTITAIGEGQAVITALARDGSGKRDEHTVQVVVPVSRVVPRPQVVMVPLRDAENDPEGRLILTLEAEVEPVAASPATANLEWSSSNNAIATVDKNTGVVTAKKAGSVKFTATNPHTKQRATVTATVVGANAFTEAVWHVTLPGEHTVPLNFNAGSRDAVKKTDQLTPLVNGEPLGNKKPLVRYTSSNPAVVAVSGTGLVTAVGAGSATVTAEVYDFAAGAWAAGPGLVPQRHYTVTKNHTSAAFADATGNRITKVVLSNLAGQGSLPVRAWFGPLDSSAALANPAGVVFTALKSSNPAVVRLGGDEAAPVLEYVGPGKAKITGKVAFGGGAARGITLEVQCKRYAVAGEFALGPLSPRVVQVGKAVKLETLLPKEVTERAITWASGNQNIATVKNGTVTGRAEGLAEITATVASPNAEGGVLVVRCPVAVQSKAGWAAQGYATKLALEQKAFTAILQGEATADTYLLTAAATPAGANTRLAWTSSNPAVAEVEAAENGSPGMRVRVKAKGSATITVCDVNTNRRASLKITVALPGERGTAPLTRLQPTGANAALGSLVVGRPVRLALKSTPAKPTNQNYVWQVVPQGENHAKITVSQTGEVRALEAFDATGAPQDAVHIEARQLGYEGDDEALMARWTITKSVRYATGFSITAGGEARQVFHFGPVQAGVAAEHQPLEIALAGASEDAGFTVSNPKNGAARLEQVDGNWRLVPLKKGKATITLTAGDAGRARATLTVYVGQQAGELALSASALTLAAGQAATLKATLYRDGSTKGIDYKELVFYESDAAGLPLAAGEAPRLAAVNAKTGRLTAKPGTTAEAETVAYVTAKDNVSGTMATCRVRVVVPPKKLTLQSPAAITVQTGSEAVLCAVDSSAYVSPEAGALRWTSSDPTRLQVAEGTTATADGVRYSVRVLALGPTAKNKPVTLTGQSLYNSKLKVSVRVTVADGAVAAPIDRLAIEGAGLSYSTSGDKQLVLDVGATSTLKAAVLPAGTAQAVYWESSHPALATVDQRGRVKLLKSFDANEVDVRIIARAAAHNTGGQPGVSHDVCRIVPRTVVKKLTLSHKTMQLTAGAPAGQVRLGFDPSAALRDGEANKVVWQCSNPQVAAVAPAVLAPDDPDFGFKLAADITPLQAGSATITATSANGKTVKFTVVVRPAQSGPPAV